MGKFIIVLLPFVLVIAIIMRGVIRESIRLAKVREQNRLMAELARQAIERGVDVPRDLFSSSEVTAEVENYPKRAIMARLFLILGVIFISFVTGLGVAAIPFMLGVGCLIIYPFESSIPRREGGGDTIF